MFMKKLFILLFDQLETDSSENIDSFTGGLLAVHRPAGLPVTKNFNFVFGHDKKYQTPLWILKILGKLCFNYYFINS